VKKVLQSGCSDLILNSKLKSELVRVRTKQSFAPRSRAEKAAQPFRHTSKAVAAAP